MQTAVAEMEKALEQPKNVGIYKQHWDHYSRIAGGLEKLSRENPVQHHLLRHFKENFWHLVERHTVLLSSGNKRRNLVKHLE